MGKSGLLTHNNTIVKGKSQCISRLDLALSSDNPSVGEFVSRGMMAIPSALTSAVASGNSRAPYRYTANIAGSLKCQPTSQLSKSSIKLLTTLLSMSGAQKTR